MNRVMMFVAVIVVLSGVWLAGCRQETPPQPIILRDPGRMIGWTCRGCGKPQTLSVAGYWDQQGTNWVSCPACDKAHPFYIPKANVTNLPRSEAE